MVQRIYPRIPTPVTSTSNWKMVAKTTTTSSPAAKQKRNRHRKAFWDYGGLRWITVTGDYGDVVDGARERHLMCHAGSVNDPAEEPSTTSP